MRLILKKEVHNLGDAGEIIKVAPGYGRNFLLPRGLAMLATEGSIRQVNHQKRMADSIRRKEHSGAQELATKIEATAITLRREAGEDEKLFGSVTNRDIADALAAEGITVDRRVIELDESIRNIGLFTVPVRLHREVSASLRVYVIRS